MSWLFLETQDFDLITEVGFVVFQPLFGVIFTTLTLIGCFIFGLPIRLIRKLKTWWLSKPLLPILGITIGSSLFVLAFVFTEPTTVVVDGRQIIKELPSTPLTITAWFMVAFFLLHFYPASLFNLIKRRKQDNSL